MNVGFIPELASFLINLGLAVYLFIRKPENTVRDIFAVGLFLISLSGLATFLTFNSTGIIQIFFERVSFALVIFALFVIFHFANMLSDKKFHIGFYLLPIALVVFCVLTDWFVVSGLQTITAEQFIPLANLYKLVISIWTVYLLYRLYTKMKIKQLRKKMFLVALGVSVLLFGIIVNVILQTLGSSFNLSTSILSVSMAVLVFYAFTGVEHAK